MEVNTPNEKQEVKEVTLLLDINEANLVLAALQELPYKISDGIIRKIIGQVQPQL